MRSLLVARRTRGSSDVGGLCLYLHDHENKKQRIGMYAIVLHMFGGACSTRSVITARVKWCPLVHRANWTI
jgi:hypothetical protein